MNFNDQTEGFAYATIEGEDINLVETRSREPQIIGQLTAIRECMTILKDQIGRLEERLHPVLAKQPGYQPLDTPINDDNMAPLAIELLELATDIESLTRWISDLYCHVEV